MIWDIQHHWILLVNMIYIYLSITWNFDSMGLSSLLTSLQHSKDNRESNTPTIEPCIFFMSPASDLQGMLQNVLIICFMLTHFYVFRYLKFYEVIFAHFQTVFHSFKPVLFHSKSICFILSHFCTNFSHFVPFSVILFQF